MVKSLTLKQVKKRIEIQRILHDSENPHVHREVARPMLRRYEELKGYSRGALALAVDLKEALDVTEMTLVTNWRIKRDPPIPRYPQKVRQHIVFVLEEVRQWLREQESDRFHGSAYVERLDSYFQEFIMDEDAAAG